MIFGLNLYAILRSLLSSHSLSPQRSFYFCRKRSVDLRKNFFIREVLQRNSACRAPGVAQSVSFAENRIYSGLLAFCRLMEFYRVVGANGDATAARYTGFFIDLANGA